MDTVIENNYVYVCGYYGSDEFKGTHTIGVYKNEENALNRMKKLCKGTEKELGYLWLFSRNDEKIDQSKLDSVITYTEFNEYIKNYCIYYNDAFVHYLYIEKVKLK